MRHGITAHPSDLIDLAEHGGYPRLAELGFQDVSLVVTQAGGRRVTPWSPTSAVQCLEEGVVHFWPGEDFGGLVPAPSRHVVRGSPSPLEEHVAGCRAAGLLPWVSVGPFHDPRLGREHPAACVHNAFGDRYPHALCPGRVEVQEYAARLVDAIAGHPGIDTIECYAIGFLGHRLGRIESSLPPDPYTDFLLSYCFCDHCVERIAQTGLDPRAIRHRVRELATERRLDVDAMQPTAPRAPEDTFRQLEEDLGAAVMFALWSHRLSVYMRLLHRLRRKIAGRARLALRVQLHSLTSGEPVGTPLKAVKALVDEVVVSHVGDPPDAISAAWRGHPVRELPTRAAIRPCAPDYRSIDDVHRALDAVAMGGGQGLRIDELGLLPWPTLEAVGAALRTAVVAAP